MGTKYDFAVACAFATQVAEADYNDTLDTISASLTAANGYLIGKSGTGLGDSGLTIGLGREFEEKAFISGSLTRPISDFLKQTVPTFTFAFPFCGNRVTIAGAPVDADFIPIAGVDAILEGAGLVGAASVSDPAVGHKYKFGSPYPFSSLIYINGMRLELEDCRCSSLAIAYTPGGFAVATATIQVRTVKDVSAAALPGTLTPGEQSTVSAPKVETVAHTWGTLRGFSELTLTIGPTITDVPDSNQTDGIVKEIEDHPVTITGTMFSDSDASGEIYDSDQLVETVEGNLNQLSFQVGTTGADTLPAEAHQIQAPLLELQASDQAKVGAKAGTSVTGVCRGAAAGSGNDELEIIFL
jgi:hypothetical protein